VHAARFDEPKTLCATTPTWLPVPTIDRAPVIPFDCGKLELHFELRGVS
jgi:hypothetical protein